MRLWMVTVLCWASLEADAAAQANDRWLVVPATSQEDASWAQPSVTRTREALAAEGVGMWTSDQAVRRFEAEGSAPPSVLTESEIQRWMSLSAAAVDDLAEGDNKKALEKLNAARDLSRAAIEEFNRDPERARRVFDSCLYRVRAVLATESESRARSVARECRRRVPRAEPTPYMHPPAVIDVLNRIDALQAKQGGELRVESSPSGCPARLNGALLGETPVSIGHLFPGKYRVQVDCDPARRGRVHVVTVGAGRTQHRVHTRFDDAISSRPDLSLHYASPSDLQARSVVDARRVRKAVAADEVVLLSMPAPSTMELELVGRRTEPSEGPKALARVSAGQSGPSQSDLAVAVRALLAGECMDFTSSEPSSLPCGRPEPIAAATTSDWPAGRRPRGQFISGLTLVGIGIAGLATGIGLAGARYNTGAAWLTALAAMPPEVLDAEESQQKWFNLGTGIIVSASVGSAALVTAMPLALPEREKTPWWAWLAGGGGIGLAAFSIAYGVTTEAEPAATSCSVEQTDPVEARTCFDRGMQQSIAILTGLTAAPLITMPLVYLLRPSKAKLEPRVEVGRRGGFVGLRGQF